MAQSQTENSDTLNIHLTFSTERRTIERIRRKRNNGGLKLIFCETE